MKLTIRYILLLCSFVFTLPAFSQEVSNEDYERAEKFLSYTTFSLVKDMNLRPNWIDEDRFWVRISDGEGTKFKLINARNKRTSDAFDHEKVALALSRASGKDYEGNRLPFLSFEYSEDEKSIVFSIRGTTYVADVKGNMCQETNDNQYLDSKSTASPDGTKAAFIREYNLWVRDLKTGAETQMTNDGTEDFGYATNNAGWVKRDTPVLTWSPDSKMIATFQHDGRGVGEMYMVSTEVGHPTLYQWKYPLPEDSVIFRVHRVVVHVDEAKVVRLKMDPDMHRSSVTDHIALRDGTISDLEWSADGSQLAFGSISRDHKDITLRVADPKTGEVRDVFKESVDTFYESGYRTINWHVLKESNEVVWFSQRDDWGHLYLYDLQTGELKSQITKGDWNVLQVLHIDEKTRKIYFIGNGREQGDPYYQYLYSTGMDVNSEGSQPEKRIQVEGLKLLSSVNSNHTITLSPGAKYFVDTYSTLDTPPVTDLISTSGKKIMTVGKSDITELKETGWVPPESFTVKGRDGTTDIYGMMWKPTHFDPNKKYPIINYIYPGPQTGSVGSRSFLPSRGDRQSLAELGFIVVAMDAMGTPLRSKSFHAAYYGDMGDNGLPDQVAGMKELASRYSWIDIDKVGIYGHSGGGFASTGAILRYPDFFDVAVSGAGNHDNRNYEDDWGEKWHGLLEKEGEGDNYDKQANHLLAGNLKGKLLISHGTLDSNVPVSNTMLVVNALIAANKDFDMILFPNRGHGYGNEPYMMRRRWDYFVQHLLGVDPPKEFEFSYGR